MSARAHGAVVPATYCSAVVEDAVCGLETSLGEGDLSFVVARVLDNIYWAGFSRDWLAERGRTFVLGVGERYPVGEMRLMGSVGHSPRPHRLDLPDGELPHVRRLSRGGIEVEVRGAYADVLDGLADGAPLTAAAALLNDTWEDLAGPSGFVAPNDPAEQTARVRRLLRQARERGAAVVVLPELCVTADMVERLAEEWAGSLDAPVLFAGSAHLADADRRVNRSSVLLPGVGVAWTHDKFSVFEDRDGVREPIDPREPGIVLGCGNIVRVATVICKDAFNRNVQTLLGDLGVHLLSIPAMSAELGPFETAANMLIDRSQGATLVADNPRVWHDEPVAHALLGHPVGDALKPETSRVVRRHPGDAAPELGISRLGRGWEQ